MRKLVEQRIRSLWLSGYDEGVPQTHDQYGYDYTIVILGGTKVTLTRYKADSRLDRVLNELSDAKLLEWLERQLCQKYR